MPSPQVSVCVPTYNGAAFLDECLAGLAAQTFRDFEVLVVDDCSSDETVDIARGWAARDDRFKIHLNPGNLGLVGNWNRCIELARGEWIKFFFQDDLIAPDCLEAMLAAGARSGGFVACSRDLRFEGEDVASVRAWYEAHQATIEAIFQGSSTLTPDAYAIAKLDQPDINIVGEPTATLIRKDLFTRFGTFDPSLTQICDSEMWSRLASNVGVTLMPERLVTFRVHGKSMSGVNRDRPFRGAVLDGILESHRLRDLPAFEAFRDCARRAGRLREIDIRLETQLNVAFYMMRDAERQQPPDKTVRHQFRTVMDQFGGFRRARNRHLWFRFRRMLGLVEAVPSDVQGGGALRSAG